MWDNNDALKFASEWIHAWNSHDLEAILSHYNSNVVLVSPVVVHLLGQGSGSVNGKDALRAYFQHALQTYPNLKFELVDVLCGINSVVLYYVNHKGTKTAEFMEFGEDRKVFRVVANYSS